MCNAHNKSMLRTYLFNYDLYLMFITLSLLGIKKLFTPQTKENINVTKKK